MTDKEKDPQTLLFLTQGPALPRPSAHTVCAGNNIGDAGATAIADALKTNTILLSVALNGMFCVYALWTVFVCRPPRPAAPSAHKKGIPFHPSFVLV